MPIAMHRPQEIEWQTERKSANKSKTHCQEIKTKRLKNNTNWPNVLVCNVLDVQAIQRHKSRCFVSCSSVFGDSFSTKQERKWYKCCVVFSVSFFLLLFDFGIQRSDNGERDTNKQRQSSVKAHADKGISKPNPIQTDRDRRRQKERLRKRRRRRNNNLYFIDKMTCQYYFKLN